MRLRQQDRPGNWDRELAGERVVEELVISRPPERIVDDDRPFQRHALKRGAIEGYFVRDAIDYHIVCRRLVIENPSEREIFSDYQTITTFIDVSNQDFSESSHQDNYNPNRFH